MSRIHPSRPDGQCRHRTGLREPSRLGVGVTAPTCRDPAATSRSSYTERCRTGPSPHAQAATMRYAASRSRHPQAAARLQRGAGLPRPRTSSETPTGPAPALHRTSAASRSSAATSSSTSAASGKVIGHHLGQPQPVDPRHLGEDPVLGTAGRPHRRPLAARVGEGDSRRQGAEDRLGGQQRAADRVPEPGDGQGQRSATRSRAPSSSTPPTGGCLPELGPLRERRGTGHSLYVGDVTVNTTPGATPASR